MEWYHYFGGFLAGLFLANAVPHFVHGISGDRFPTPFSKPHGKGLSSSTVNVVWALFNIIIGYVLYHLSKTSAQNIFSLIVMFIGVACIAIFSSRQFSNKDKE